MSVTDTSISALKAHEDCGEAKKVREAIVSQLIAEGKKTRAELSRDIGKEMHIISGRVGDFWEGALVDGYTLIKSGKKVCSVGGKKVEALEVKKLDLESCMAMVHTMRRKYKAEKAAKQGIERAYKAVL